MKCVDQAKDAWVAMHANLFEQSRRRPAKITGKSGGWQIEDDCDIYGFKCMAAAVGVIAPDKIFRSD